MESATQRYMLIILLVIHSQNACVLFEENSIESPYLHFLKMLTFNIFGRTSNQNLTMGMLKSKERLQNKVLDFVPFMCDTSNMRSKTKPTSVHRLRPGDIDVVAAIGDSLTAANGATATNIVEVLYENRGVSFSIGGQGTWREFLTLPNILKEYNPNLIGYSTGDSLLEDDESQLNGAVLGAMTKDLAYMARRLITRILNDPRIDLKNDWKLITVMIGANDFCFELCETSPQIFIESFKQRIVNFLRTLRDALPRTLVNFITSPNIKLLVGMTKKPLFCQALHPMACKCLFGLFNSMSSETISQTITKIQKLELEITLMEEFNNRSDFAVVWQPFTLKLKLPHNQFKLTDYTVLSEDCFHLSQKGYARAANALWNNMFEPIGHKSTDWSDILKIFKCPNETHPYIYTVQNSNVNNYIKDALLD